MSQVSRPRIDITGSMVYQASLPIRVSDLNYGKHVGHDRFLSLIHEARVQFLEHHDYNEGDIQGCGLIVASVEATYKRQMFYGETAVIDIHLGAMDKRKLEMLYVLRNQSGQDVVKSRIICAFIDYQTQQIKPVPEFFVELS